MSDNSVQIKVFATSTRKFRARVKKKGELPYEVTIGGEAWNAGKGKEFKGQILAKTKNMINALSREYKSIVRREYELDK